MQDKRLKAEALSRLAPTDTQGAYAMLSEALTHGAQIVVLDDDPTGVQTVHNVHVYTDWSQESVDSGFAEESSMFFILTNSRGMSHEEACKANREIALAVLNASEKSGKPFILISRSDSTLRGHYPAETDSLRKTIEENSGIRFDGEILCPFFLEGGRFTLNNIHYVREGDQLTPAAQTEFAQDRTFGYTHSHLGEWCEATGPFFRMLN